MDRVPRVSVLIPVRNARPYLDTALASVRRQTLRDFEVVCVDDGSTDGSGEDLDRQAAADGRFRILHPGRIGLVAALNLLREEARAPLLGRFDADDVMHPRRLELQTGHLDAHPEVDVVSSLVRHFPQGDVKGGNQAYEAWLNSLVTHDEIVRDMFVELPLPNPSVTMRAHVYERAGGFVDNGRPEDYDFWLRAWQAGCRFAKVPRVLHFWREHPLRVTRTDPRYSVEAFLRAKVDGLLRGPLKETRPFVVWGAGMMGRRLLRLLLRAGRRPPAILDIDPKKIGRTRYGVPILPPDAVRPGSALVLGAVGSRGARELIRARLEEWGLKETRDFWMCA
ncbi:MAG: glycosyltransferase family 2 protein [Planctomycetota bacterium]|nr:glycosyltransferase family 2 protein [Planctomycetota bacterium]